jgi:hypothetical protein
MKCLWDLNTNLSFDDGPTPKAMPDKPTFTGQLLHLYDFDKNCDEKFFTTLIHQVSPETDHSFRWPFDRSLLLWLHCCDDVQVGKIEEHLTKVMESAHVLRWESIDAYLQRMTPS